MPPTIPATPQTSHPVNHGRSPRYSVAQFKALASRKTQKAILKSRYSSTFPTSAKCTLIRASRPSMNLARAEALNYRNQVPLKWYFLTWDLRLSTTFLNHPSMHLAPSLAMVKNEVVCKACSPTLQKPHRLNSFISKHCHGS